MTADTIVFVSRADMRAAFGNGETEYSRGCMECFTEQLDRYYQTATLSNMNDPVPVQKNDVIVAFGGKEAVRRSLAGFITRDNGDAWATAIAAGSDLINEADPDGGTLLMVAAYFGRLDRVKELVRMGAEVTKRGGREMLTAAEYATSRIKAYESYSGPSNARPRDCAEYLRYSPEVLSQT